MDKEEFTRRLSGAKMNQDEINLLFHTLDLSRDGYFNTSDFRSMEKLAGYHSSRQLPVDLKETRVKGPKGNHL